ncbi:tetratricopeptide repeat protein [Diaminobutyricimonas sp. LJ205]|uniref:tetratricopeptide repeat protein n=1 Tax=Diaminobutyricimonas sp. LJ205 TaxID=2683590 RepID=UPI0012F488E3|nr:tetratricopeptide repeat protein [Diaminobutyricimonas sp. LJ205]
MTDAWTEQVAAVWAAADELDDSEVLRRIDAIVLAAMGLDSAEPDAAAALVTDAAALFELASARDYADREADAAPLYESALAAGLEEPLRGQAVIQLASTLRNLGRADAAIALLQESFGDEPEHPLADAARAFLALCYASRGETATATAIALDALAGHLPQYQRSVRAYAAELASSEQPKRQIRLMNDYGAEVPLWDDGGLADSGSLPLSDELIERLKAWAAQFEQCMDPQTGWREAALVEAHRAEAHALREAVAHALGADFHVVLLLWELDGR